MIHVVVLTRYQALHDSLIRAFILAFIVVSYPSQHCLPKQLDGSKQIRQIPNFDESD